MEQEFTVTGVRMTLPGDTVQKALDRLEGEKEITQEERKEIWWLYSYSMENNYSFADAGKAIGKDSSTVHRLFTGRYGAKYSGLVSSIMKFHKLADERGARKNVRFIETSTYTKIEQICRHALVGQHTAFITGNSQIGKTCCLKEYARRNNHGQTKYIEIPEPASISAVQHEMARACYISTKASANTVGPRLLEAISDQMLIIVDEIHRPFVTSSEKTALRIIEWLRYIYDNTGCGMVFCGTNIFNDELHDGRQSRVLEQVRRRGIIELALPETPPKADIDKFAAEFGLPPPDGAASDIIGTMLRKSGLKQYVVFLQSANNLAQKQKKPISWDHFIAAYDLINSMSRKK